MTYMYGVSYTEALVTSAEETALFT
jgi:hypothetical protein